MLAPGLLTTVQDRGRHGWRHLGVACAGALDAYSLQIANRLVGNRPDAAVLEITLAGPRLRFHRAVRIALCGADIDAQAGERALPGWRPIDLPARTELALGHCRRGARAILAIAGGIDVARVLGSAATDLRGGFGGLDGRALRAGDRLALATTNLVDANARSVDRIHIAPWWIDPTPDLDFDLPALARVLPGSDACVPSDALFAHGWKISAHSDRQGLRLHGGLLLPADPRERISEPVLPGSVQLPPDGNPIVLLADAQTHGGYPHIGQVIAADLPRLAQLRPGETLHFAPAPPAQAQAARHAQLQRLRRIALAIAAK